MRVGRVLLVGALAAVALAAPTTASASDTCGSGHACLYGNNDFKWKLSDRAKGGGLSKLTGDKNNEMDSWINGSGTNAAGYDGASGTGDCQTFSKYSNDNNVAPWNSDEISAWRTNHGC